jgi:hypothetical protein
MTFWLLELAKELRAKAGDVEREPGSVAAYEVSPTDPGRAAELKLH